MRIAVIGPIGQEESQLDRALVLAFEELQVDRAVYLGDPDLVIRGRQDSVPPGEMGSIWRRSLVCLEADPAAIEYFVAMERRKLDWARLEFVPEPGGLCFALSGASTLVVCFRLDEGRTEVAAARVVITSGTPGDIAFGFRENGARLVLVPGTLDEAGVAVVNDENELSVELYDVVGKELGRQRVSAPPAQPHGSVAP